MPRRERLPAAFAALAGDPVRFSRQVVLSLVGLFHCARIQPKKRFHLFTTVFSFMAILPGSLGWRVGQVRIRFAEPMHDGAK